MLLTFKIGYDYLVVPVNSTTVDLVDMLCQAKMCRQTYIDGAGLRFEAKDSSLEFALASDSALLPLKPVEEKQAEEIVQLSKRNDELRTEVEALKKEAVPA